MTLKPTVQLKNTIFHTLFKVRRNAFVASALEPCLEEFKTTKGLVFTQESLTAALLNA
jgi:hypothetical protein